MVQTQKYNGSLTREQFLFYEIRIAAKFYLDGKTLPEEVKFIKQDNLFQYPTERIVSNITRVCYRRVNALGNRILVEEIANAPTDKAVVTRRIAPSEDLMRKSTTFLRNYLGAMDIPSDEDRLIHFVTSTFESRMMHYQTLLNEAYSCGRYPEREVVTSARDLMQNVLSQRKDNVALLTRMVQKQDDLLDSEEDLEGIEMFFKSQRVVFDDARKQMECVNKERDYFATDVEALDIFKTISTILAMSKPHGRIGELPELIMKVKEKYDALLDVKRAEVAEIVRQGMEDVHQLAGEASDTRDLLRQADDWLVKKREALKEATSLTDLDAMITQVLNYKDNICRRMEMRVAGSQTPADPKDRNMPAPKTRKITTVRRYDLCSVKRLQTEEDIDRYVEGIREKLLQTLSGCDGIQIS